MPDADSPFGQAGSTVASEGVSEFLRSLPRTVNERTGQVQHGSVDLAAIPGVRSTDSGLTNSDLLAARRGRTFQMSLDEFLDRAAKNGGVAANQDGVHIDKVDAMLRDGADSSSSFNAVVDGQGTVHIADGHSRTAAALVQRHVSGSDMSDVGQAVTVNVTLSREVLGQRR